MKKVVLIILVVILLTGCRKDASTNKRMRKIESGFDYAVIMDTNTGICYLRTGNEVVVLLDHDGSPYVENGWRDYD